MASNNDTDYLPSPTNEETDNEDELPLKHGQEDIDEDEELSNGSNNDHVAELLKQLQSSGALKKPKQEYHCQTCIEDFTSWSTFEQHLLQHVSLPTVLVDKLQSDAESDTAQSGDDNWSDEEETPKVPLPGAKPPQKLDISQILKKTGISIKPADKPVPDAGSALNKLSGLGFTIKKNVTPIKQEKTEPEGKTSNDDLMQRLGKLGGIKLKLKSEGSDTNSFKVVNGLKDFKTSDDEGEGSTNEDEQKSGDEHEEEFDEDRYKMEVHDKEDGGEQEPDDEHNTSGSRKSSESDDNSFDKNASNTNLKKILASPKVEPIKILKANITKLPLVMAKANPGRPSVKQTPKRNLQEIFKSSAQNESQKSPTQSSQITTSSVPQKSATETNIMENVVVKQEVDSGTGTQLTLPIFSGQIKTEHKSPPGTPVTMTTVKSEIDPVIPNAQTQPLFSEQNLLPVTKKEDANVIIEINGDSNDEDDDCCVVSATPAPDVKPIIPKTETPAYQSIPYPNSQQNVSSSTAMPTSHSSTTSSTMPSTEKQHNFNWNAPDTKPPLDILSKSADDIFESLLSSATKKENLSLMDTSEYISLDRLGPQHSCTVCNTRFTSVSLLDDHIRATGHTKVIITPSSSTLLPYNQSSNSLMSSLLPVKHIAEQVGKLSAIGGGGSGAFTHQQNVMINIQAYPGAPGMLVPAQTYNPYGSGQNMPPDYQGNNTMYTQPMPGQPYAGSSYMGQQSYGQGTYQTPISKAGYPVSVPTSPYSTAPGTYSTASPLQSMQQAVYGQAAPSIMNVTTSPLIGQMGPPGQIPSPGHMTGHQYVPTSSPGSMKPPPAPSGIKIQNVQTFPPGHLGGPGQMMAPGSIGAPGQMNSGQMRPSIPNIAPKLRAPGIRAGSRPSIRAGIQVHGQTIRGGKTGGPRMPVKRGPGMPGGPGAKRRPDMLLPGKHDNEDCHVMAMQKQREGLPMIHSVQGAKDKLNLGSQISITKKTVNKEANAMANVLASRGIMVKQKQKSRSPSPERPVPHIPNLGAGVSIKHTSKSSNFSIPEAKVGGGMYACKVCRKMFMNYNSLSVHMNTAHSQNMFKCDECPSSYPKSLQLQHHKRVFHNVTGPNRELGLPVVDLSQEDNLKRLSNLGIYSFIPLANREQASGCFGIPVISVHNVNNGMTNSLQALGADGLLSLGPLKPLPNS